MPRLNGLRRSYSCYKDLCFLEDQTPQVGLGNIRTNKNSSRVDKDPEFVELPYYFPYKPRGV
jgi:hypothetical protein